MEIISDIIVSLGSVGCHLVVILLMIIAAGSIVIGLPGEMFVVGIAGAYVFLGGDVIGWWGVFGFLVLGCIAEGVELIAGMYGAKRYGGSWGAAFGAFVGGVVGAILGTMIIPIIGSLAGALGGSFLGALIVEQMNGRDDEEAIRAGYGAFLGRIVGLSCKFSAATVMIVLFSASWMFSDNIETKAEAEVFASQSKTAILKDSKVEAVLESSTK